MTNLAKRVSILLIISIMLCSATSCKRIQNIKNALGVSSDSAKYLNCARECFDNRDVNGLYSLFSKESKQYKYLKQRIELLYYYWDLLDLDDSQIKEGGQTGGMSVRDGKITYYDDSLSIENYYDKDGNKYCISFYSTAVNKNDLDSEGLHSFCIEYYNSVVYMTSIDKRDITDDAFIIDNLLEREKAVLKKIEDAKADNAYILADNEGRVVFMRQLLKDIIKEEMGQYGNSVINQDSIEDYETDDSYNDFPALRFKFVDGGRLLILVHNHPKR